MYVRSGKDISIKFVKSQKIFTLKLKKTFFLDLLFSCATLNFNNKILY